MSVIRRDPTQTSGIDLASARRNAIACPSFENENAEFTVCAVSVPATLFMAFDSGSSRYRYEYVRSLAEKKMPAAFHATRFGSSSKADVSGTGAPPAAGTTAMRPFM